VQFGAMIELARAEVEDARLRRGVAKWIERFALRHVLPHPRRLRAAVSLLAAVQRLGLDRGLRHFLPRGLRALQEQVPRVPRREERRPLPREIAAMGARRGRVALFAGCVMPELFGAVNAATVRVLARNGFDVVVPEDQGCCGALHAHSGDEATAHALARRNVTAFHAAQVDAVIVNSAGCGAALRDAGRWLPGTGAELAASVRDVTEFLDAQGLRAPTGRVDARVCVDDPCHLVHGQGVRAAPRRLLAQVPGLVLVPHTDPESCCGAAGIYNLTHREMAQAVLERKLDALVDAAPDVVVSGNPGCLMQLRRGVLQRELRARVAHPIELLDEAYGGAAE
jgi:glycolate oxidase iron-sulfur subunit